MFFGPLGANFRENHVTPPIHVNAVEQEGADLGNFRDFFRDPTNSQKTTTNM